MERVIALIDGEHYPPVVRAALDRLAYDVEIAAAVFIGGTEKVDLDRGPESYGVPLIAGADALSSLEAAIEAYRPDAVVDLSDEPVLSASDRMRLASAALAHGVSYRGADFVFTPPRVRFTPVTPTLAVIGTGKRVGKTAMSAAIARCARSGDMDPVVLAMGRGGPETPELIRGDMISLTTRDLLAVAAEGKHASSDNYEDAVMSRVTTVGCRRCGGGLVGETFFDNVVEGAELADSLGKDVMLLEGSGAAIPPVFADATILVVGAMRGAEAVRDHLGPFRVAKADLVLIAGADAPWATPAEIEAIRDAVRAVSPDVPIVETTFHPSPLVPIAGRRVLFATTAPPVLADRLAESLASRHGCEVVAVTTALSDRSALRADLAAYAGSYDLLVTELKAAAIDVVARAGEEIGVETVLCDNVPEGVDGSSLDELFDGILRTAIARGALREGEGS